MVKYVEGPKLQGPTRKRTLNQVRHGPHPMCPDQFGRGLEARRAPEHHPAGISLWRFWLNFYRLGPTVLQRCLGLRNGSHSKSWCEPITYFLSRAQLLKRRKEPKILLMFLGRRGCYSILKVWKFCRVLRRQVTRLPVLLSEEMEFHWVTGFGGSTETLIKGRLTAGRKMFAELKPMLCCPKIPEEECLKAFYTTAQTRDNSSRFKKTDALDYAGRPEGHRC